LVQITGVLVLNGDTFFSMKIEQKKNIVRQLKESFERARSVVFVDFSGLGTGTIETLRKEITKLGGGVQIAKNTLIERALNQQTNLEGPTAIIFSFDDPIPPIKAVAEFADKPEEKPWIKGGFFEGAPIEAPKVLEISSIPGRDALLAGLTQQLIAPLRQLTIVINTPTRNFVTIVKELSQQRARGNGQDSTDS